MLNIICYISNQKDLSSLFAKENTKANSYDSQIIFCLVFDWLNEQPIRCQSFWTHYPYNNVFILVIKFKKSYSVHTTEIQNLIIL